MRLSEKPVPIMATFSFCLGMVYRRWNAHFRTQRTVPETSCHPERSKFARFASELMQSKDPYDHHNASVQSIPKISSFPTYAKPRGVLRLRRNFAMRSFYSAQDDSEPSCDKVCRKRKMPHLSQTT